MKACVLYNLKQPLKILDNIEIPPLSDGQVLVKLAYSGVCHSQIMEAQGMRGDDKFLPHLLGHEGSGVVVEIGNNVTKVKPEDRVILGWIKGKGIDSGGVQYKKGDEIINAGAVTTFNEYAVVSENRCVRIPDSIPMDIAVLFGCALPTGAGMVLNTIKPEEGSTILFLGLGGIGLSALMAASVFNCSKIIAADVEGDKLQLAKEFGATHTINASRDGLYQNVLDVTDGAGVDYSVEAAGKIETIELAFQSVRKNGGLCLFASHPKAGGKIKIDPFDLISGKRIMGSWGGDSRPDEDIPRIAKLYLEGRLPLEKLLTHRYALDDVNSAFDAIVNRKVGRALIEIDPSIK